MTLIEHNLLIKRNQYSLMTTGYKAMKYQLTFNLSTIGSCKELTREQSQ